MTAATSAATTPEPGAASALLRWQFSLAHRLLEDTVASLPQASIDQHPSGTTAPAAACYAHIVYCEDLTVNGVLSGGRPLALSAWASRTGLSELPPLGGSIASPVAEQAAWYAWGRRVQLDLAALRAYAQAVYAATDTHLATLPDAVLDPSRRELPGCLLNALLLTLSMRRGEIATLSTLNGQPVAHPT
jgi:hypothetical protein